MTSQPAALPAPTVVLASSPVSAAVLASSPPTPGGIAAPAHLSRIVADSTDRIAWLRARATGITATDAAQFSSDKATLSAAWRKAYGGGFSGNVYTEHGKARESVIADWAQRVYRLQRSTLLFHAESSRRHLATPDGLRLVPEGVELAEYKTTAKAWRSIPRNYLRQIWWQQYVLGAERTLIVWEQHRDFVPVSGEPQCRWVDRDEDEIAMLLRRAEIFLDALSNLA